MRALADLLPPLLWALSIASHVYLVLKHANLKERPMSEAISTALPDPVQSAQAFAEHPLTQAVVQVVNTNPAIAPHNAADVAASMLDALMPLVQPALQVSRASPRTSAEVAIAVAAMSALLSVFHPHPALSVAQVQ